MHLGLAKTRTPGVGVPRRRAAGRGPGARRIPEAALGPGHWQVTGRSTTLAGQSTLARKSGSNDKRPWSTGTAPRRGPGHCQWQLQDEAPATGTPLAGWQMRSKKGRTFVGAVLPGQGRGIWRTANRRYGPPPLAPPSPRRIGSLGDASGRDLVAPSESRETGGGHTASASHALAVGHGSAQGAWGPRLCPAT